jgi:hypothetical protein
VLEDEKTFCKPGRIATVDGVPRVETLVTVELAAVDGPLQAVSTRARVDGPF